MLALGTWFYDHLNCTDIDILFDSLMTNVLIVSPFVIKASAEGPKCKCESIRFQLMCADGRLVERILPLHDGQGGSPDWVVEFETVEGSGSALDLVITLDLEHSHR